jgi:hypothetical protein
MTWCRLDVKLRIYQLMLLAISHEIPRKHIAQINHCGLIPTGVKNKQSVTEEMRLWSKSFTKPAPTKS